MNRVLVAVVFALAPYGALSACGDDSAPVVEDPFDAGDGMAQGTGGTDGEVDAGDGCRGAILEDDLPREPLAGPGIIDGEVPPGDYALSTTYLRLKADDETRSRFLELAGAAIGDAMGRDGLIGMAVAMSEDCGVGRTLSVWRDEQAMYEFVAGEAHAAAMAAIGEVSRGGSLAMHWLGDESEANWETGAAQIAAFDGTRY